MKNITLQITGFIFLIFSYSSHAGNISDTYIDGDMLTSSHLNHAKNAVNDNNTRIDSNVTDINSLDARMTNVETTQSSQTSFGSDINTLDARVTNVENTQTAQLTFSQMGYAWANSPSPGGEYTPHLAYSYNSSGFGVTVDKTSLGLYTVKFVGLSGLAGTVSVGSYQAGIVCNAIAWYGSSDWYVDVECHDAAGIQIDSLFTIQVMSLN